MLSCRREELDPLSGNELWHGHHRLTAFSLAITLELLVLYSSIGHSSRSRTKGDGAHLTKTQTRTVLKEQTEGALSKALSVAGLMGPGHRLPTCSLDWWVQVTNSLLVLFSSPNKARLQSTFCWSCHLHCRSITSCHLVRPDHVVVRLASHQLCQAQASLNTDGRQGY